MNLLPACVAVAGVAPAQTKNTRDSQESAAGGTSGWRRPAIAALIFIAAAFSPAVSAQEPPSLEFGAQTQIIPGSPVGIVEVSETGDIVTATNFYVKYGDTFLTADSGTIHPQSGEIEADGRVRIEQAGGLWVGEHINYNFKTHQMRSEQFRTGKPPVFAAGRDLQGDISNKVYSARNILVTTDDVSDPAVYVRASRMRMVPGQYIEAWNAVVFLDGVPAFYYPYYQRNLGPHANNFNFQPGYRSAFGPYLLGTYSWWLNDTMDGVVHADYRERRGVGAGPDLNLHLDRWGDVMFKYYYLHDQTPNSSEGTNIFRIWGRFQKTGSACISAGRRRRGRT